MCHIEEDELNAMEPVIAFGEKDGGKSQVGKGKAAKAPAKAPAKRKSSPRAETKAIVATLAGEAVAEATPKPARKAPAKKAAAKKPAARKRVAKKPAGPTKPRMLAKPRRGKADDLKLISGVGPKLEGVLNGLGVWHFDQIAAWTKAEIDWVDDHLKFKGRIERDEWIKQAKKLAKK